MAAPSRTHLLSLYRHLLRELPVRQPSTTTTTAQTPARSRLSSPSALQTRIRAAFASQLAQPAQNDTQTQNQNQTQKHSQNQNQRQRQSSHAALAQAQLAEQFVKYVAAQRQYVTLVERYNPGLGMSEEDRVRLTARRVGMDMPEEWYGKK
ncbi:uncharacterized protein EI97DRAFT_435456 [Westerdykella ornata]|uniref:ATP synthase assembly factor FMC1, mitochondrial n=1 Tax=Westerdykella ornata TaxID=318751 RepID=A0A6A6JD39_WESOR|nr:uncharacterized protein EI97DRAFT_435456 [Westerdykella ornata]KAF2274093.1 hypothetical protein EI97DRAFT_435456 [Westerdykella ornata]